MASPITPHVSGMYVQLASLFMAAKIWSQIRSLRLVMIRARTELEQGQTCVNLASLPCDVISLIENDISASVYASAANAYPFVFNARCCLRSPGETDEWYDLYDEALREYATSHGWHPAGNDDDDEDDGQEVPYHFEEQFRRTPTYKVLAIRIHSDRTDDCKVRISEEFWLSLCQLMHSAVEIDIWDEELKKATQIIEVFLRDHNLVFPRKPLKSADWLSFRAHLSALCQKDAQNTAGVQTVPDPFEESDAKEGVFSSEILRIGKIHEIEPTPSFSRFRHLHFLHVLDTAGPSKKHYPVGALMQFGLQGLT